MMKNYVEELQAKMSLDEMKKDLLSIVKEKCDWINLDDTPEEERNKYLPSLYKDDLNNEIARHLKWQSEERGVNVENLQFEKKTVFSIPNDGDLYVVVYSSEVGIDFIVEIILTDDAEFDDLKLSTVNGKERITLFEKTRSGGDW